VADPLETLRERLADRAALDVNADLELRFDGGTVHVESYTDHVVVTVPSASVGVRALRKGGAARLRRAGVAPDLLAAAGLSAELRVGSRTVARFGAGVTPGPLARALGWGPVRLRPGGLVLAAVFD
jgi:hypothetical protein